MFFDYTVVIAGIIAVVELSQGLSSYFYKCHFMLFTVKKVALDV